MRKKFSSILAVIALCGVCLVGCGSTTYAVEQGTEIAANEEVKKEVSDVKVLSDKPKNYTFCASVDFRDSIIKNDYTISRIEANGDSVFYYIADSDDYLEVKDGLLYMYRGNYVEIFSDFTILH